MKIETTRDHYLDFLRGIAAVNIIFIHTVFWSGTAYVPAAIQSFSLILDVPFFFFLSGWSFTYTQSFTKSIRSLISTYTKYLFFLIFYILCLLAIAGITGNSSGISAQNFLGHLFFLQFETSSLPVVMSSMWFLPVYFVVVPIGSALIRILKLVAKEENESELYLSRVLISVVFAWLFYIYLVQQKSLFKIRLLFHLFFFLLGAIYKDIKIFHFKNALLFIAIDLFLMKGIGAYHGWDISLSMQQMKYPPNVVYLLYSLIAIIIALWGKRCQVTSRNFFCKIGRKAIWFYFSQGISSSLLYFISSRIQFPWPGKLLFMFGANVAICLILVIGLSQAWTVLKIHISKLRTALKYNLPSKM